MAITTDPDIDQIRVQLLQACRVDLRSTQRSHARIIGQEHIRARDHPVKQRAIGIVFDIQLHTSLVAVGGKKVRALAIEKWGSPTS